MKYFLVLLFFFIYNISLFFVNDYYILGIIFIFNLILSFKLKISLKKHITFLKHNLLFVIFIFICNIFFSNLNESIKVSIRLFLIIDYTYIMNNYFTPSTLKEAFTYLLAPLRIFKVNTNNLTLIISISLAFIPIMIDEATIIKYSLKSKGFAFNFKNVITRPQIFLITYLNSLFNRIDELERSLIVKGFQ